jgi:hypothetical protein
MEPPVSITRRLARPLGGGPATTAPLLGSNVPPWQGQTIWPF